MHFSKASCMHFAATVAVASLVAAFPALDLDDSNLDTTSHSQHPIMDPQTTLLQFDSDMKEVPFILEKETNLQRRSDDEESLYYSATSDQENSDVDDVISGVIAGLMNVNLKKTGEAEMRYDEEATSNAYYSDGLADDEDEDDTGSVGFADQGNNAIGLVYLYQKFPSCAPHVDDAFELSLEVRNIDIVRVFGPLSDADIPDCPEYCHALVDLERLIREGQSFATSSNRCAAVRAMLGLNVRNASNIAKLNTGSSECILMSAPDDDGMDVDEPVGRPPAIFDWSSNSATPVRYVTGDCQLSEDDPLILRMMEVGSRFDVKGSNRRRNRHSRKRQPVSALSIVPISSTAKNGVDDKIGSTQDGNSKTVEVKTMEDIKTEVVTTEEVKNDVTNPTDPLDSKQDGEHVDTKEDNAETPSDATGNQENAVKSKEQFEEKLLRDMEQEQQRLEWEFIQERRHNHRTAIIVGVVTAFVLFVLLTVTGCFLRKRIFARREARKMDERLHTLFETPYPVDPVAVAERIKSSSTPLSGTPMSPPVESLGRLRVVAVGSSTTNYHKLYRDSTQQSATTTPSDCSHRTSVTTPVCQGHTNRLSQTTNPGPVRKMVQFSEISQQPSLQFVHQAPIDELQVPTMAMVPERQNSDKDVSMSSSVGNIHHHVYKTNSPDSIYSAMDPNVIEDPQMENTPPRH